MKDLIEALTIFMKYTGNIKHPINSMDEKLYVDCNPLFVSEEDNKRLGKLGFYIDKDKFFCFLFS